MIKKVFIYQFLHIHDFEIGIIVVAQSCAFKKKCFVCLHKKRVQHAKISCFLMVKKKTKLFLEMFGKQSITSWFIPICNSLCTFFMSRKRSFEF